MEILYQEYDIQVIFKHFADGFKPRKGRGGISKWETFYDSHTGKVIFKLYVEKQNPK